MTPAPGGRWRAICDCGRESYHDDQTAAWEWLLGHPCDPEQVDLDR